MDHRTKIQIIQKESFQVLFFSSPDGAFSPKITKTSQYWMHMQIQLGYYFYYYLHDSCFHSIFFLLKIYEIAYFIFLKCKWQFIFKPSLLHYQHYWFPDKDMQFLSSSMPPCVTVEARAFTHEFINVYGYFSHSLSTDGSSLCSLKVSFLTSNNHVSKRGTICHAHCSIGPMPVLLQDNFEHVPYIFVLI